jgi:hypothetical protein
MRRTRSLRIQQELENVEVYLFSRPLLDLSPGTIICYCPAGSSPHLLTGGHEDQYRRQHIAYSMILDLQDSQEVGPGLPRSRRRSAL